MQCPHKPYPDDQYMAWLLVGDKKALAYEWLNAYLKNLNDQIGQSNQYDEEYGGYSGGGSPLTLDELINVGMSHVSADTSWGGDYITRGGTFEGFSTDPTFWDKLADLKEIDVPSHTRGNFFSCSC